VTVTLLMTTLSPHVCERAVFVVVVALVFVVE
jgi:hypothetical protein